MSLSSTNVLVQVYKQWIVLSQSACFKFSAVVVCENPHPHSLGSINSRCLELYSSSGAGGCELSRANQNASATDTNDFSFLTILFPCEKCCEHSGGINRPTRLTCRIRDVVEILVRNAVCGVEKHEVRYAYSYFIVGFLSTL